MHRLPALNQCGGVLAGQGEQRSRDYNDNLRYNNMRYAMLGMLRRPP
eukprot:COSAG02_NODE_19451_length_881_cov_1.167519_1_plen_46_part_10